MDGVVEDNIDISLFIGGDEAPPEEWELVEAEVVLTTRSTPDYVDMRITPADGVDYPDRPQVPFDLDAEPEDDASPGGYLGRQFTLDVDTSLRATTPGPEVTRIFTGAIANMTALGDYTYEAVAYDPTQQSFAAGEDDTTQFMNSTINIAPASPRIIRNLLGGYYDNSYEPGDRRLLISELAEMVLDEAGVDEENRNINVQDNGIEVGEKPNGEKVIKGYDYDVTFSEWEVPVKDILERITFASRADWWFDRYGNFNFGPRIPDENIFAYDLQYITDSSDGKTTPPYRSVQVIGDGVASEEGWSRSSLINESPITSAGNVDVQTTTDNLAEPVFTYRNMEINTQQEAENIKNDILEKLREQTGTGDITVVGFPEVRPGDGVELPNTSDQPMGGERYGVEQVTHRINSSDGFITKIKVAGLAGEQEVLYNDDIESVKTEILNERSPRQGSPFRLQR